MPLLVISSLLSCLYFMRSHARTMAHHPVLVNAELHDIMPTDVPLIAVIGSHGSGRQSLVRAIVGDSAIPTTSGYYVWGIDNKYYLAQTRISVYAPDNSTAGFRGEAVLLVFDGTSEASFQAVKAWAEVHDTEAAEVRLMVATHADRLIQHAAQPDSSHEPSCSGPLNPKRSGWLDAAIDYAIEHCFEYIEVCCTDPAIDSRLQLDGDAQGIKRVVGALHAHMWPGLVRKQPQAGGMRHLDADSEEAKDELLENTNTSQVAATQSDAVATASSSTEVQQEAQEGGAGSLSRQASQAPGSTGSTQPPATCGPECDISEDEHDAEAFERMLEEMMEAKARLGTLSDAQRREQAAALAMKFAAMMGSGSSVDDDDDAAW